MDADPGKYRDKREKWKHITAVVEGEQRKEKIQKTAA
jgi:hypothetical protein